MANETTSTTLDGLVEEIKAETIFQFNQNATILQCINWLDTEGQPGITAEFPVYSNIAASDVNQPSEGTDLTTNKQIDNADVSAKVAENVIKATITDLSQMGTRANVVDDISAMFANSLLAQLESEIVTLYAGFDSTTVSGISAANAMSLDTWFGAIAALKSAGANVGDLCAVLSPQQYYGSNGLRGLLSDNSSSAGTNSQSERFLNQGFTDVVSGIPIYVSNQITETTSASGGIYEKKRALGLHTKGLVSIEPQRDASLRGVELVAVGRWKAVELIDTLGVEMVSLL